MTDAASNVRHRLAPLLGARIRHLPDGTLVVRPSYLTMFYSTMPLLALLIPVATWVRRGTVGDRGFFVFWLALLAIDGTVAILIGTRRQVELGPTTLRHRNIVRWHTIAAEDIQAVTLSDMGMTETLRVWTSDRQSHRPAALTSRELQLVGDWWVAHRGADWRPAWGPPPPPEPTPWSALPTGPWQA